MYLPRARWCSLCVILLDSITSSKENGVLKRGYILQNIKEEPISKSRRLSRPHHLATNSSVISISNLFKLVNNYDEDFNPKPVNPLRVFVLYLFYGAPWGEKASLKLCFKWSADAKRISVRKCISQGRDDVTTVLYWESPSCPCLCTHFIWQQS